MYVVGLVVNELIMLQHNMKPGILIDQINKVPLLVIIKLNILVNNIKY